MADDLNAALAAMRERYASAAANTVAAFERLAEQLDTEPAAVALLTALRRELHRVHGTAGSVGFEEASRLAASMETLATRWLDDPALDHERRGAVVAQFARSLRESLAAKGDSAPQAGAQESERLLLVGLTHELASGLIAEGLARGLRVERVTVPAFQTSIELERPAGIVTLNAAVPDGAADGVPRIVLLEPGADDFDLTAAAGQRVLDSRSEPTVILDALALLRQVSGTHGGSIVIVDDDPVVRAMLKMLLEHEGYRVVTRASAHGFMAAVRSAHPLLLVLDVDLAKSSGVTLAKKIRAAPDFPDLPILMLTGHADSETRNAAFASGADDYMLKPLVPKEFQQRVARLIETRRQRRATGGLHETSGLSLRARTMREIESLLRTRTGRVTSVCVVRPLEKPYGAEKEAAWHRESARIARAVRAVDGFAGLLDAAAVGGALPLPAADALELFTALFAEVSHGVPAWNVGIANVAGQAGGAAQTPRTLIDSAEAACLAARESNVCGRLWNPADFDIAPDVIVVEDDDALAEMEQFALESRGLSHRRFATGPAALEALGRMRSHGRRPIILLDIDLPGLDGHSLHERLRIERPNTFDVVFVSAHSSESDQLRALQAGALDFITKPVRMRVLMAKIDSWRTRMTSA
jgi:DNA-binding response OmpR family regulator/HPt (histidine-containing phosphotransfer) domain-containing protein